jgi:glycosyltransferase involved in cell wall biosynthesis
LTLPDATVVIPTRDRCRRLELAVRSALGQTGVELEVLIVDDGSTDATEHMVLSIPDPRVRCLRRPVSEGVSVARNLGIAEARGRWVGFLDDDDAWAPTKLRCQIDAMVSSGRTWSYAGDVLVDGELEVLSGGPPPPPDEVVRLLERYNSVPAGASNVVVHADTLAAAGPFDVGLTNVADWDMWIRLARVGPPDWVRGPLVAISHHPQAMSRDSEEMIRQLRVVADRYGIPVDLARHHRWAAWYALLDGRRADATRSYARAVAAGDLGSLLRASAAVVAPGFALRRVRPRADERDPWIAEARAWLDALKERPGVSPCGCG